MKVLRVRKCQSIAAVLLGLMVCLFGVATAVPVTPDPTFLTGVGPNNSLTALEKATDGSLWIGGNFNTVDGENRKSVAKLTTDGALDPSFSPPTQLNSVSTLAPLAGGGVMVGGGYLGYFTTKSIYGMLLLDATGAVDPGFDASAVVGTNSVSAMVPLADGKWLIGGSFSGGVARLMPDGSRDSSFDPGVGKPSGGSVNRLLVLPSGKILVAGSFSSFAGQARANLCRLNADGSLDSSFGTASSSPSASVYSVAVQENGQLLIGGNFSSIGGTTQNYLARLDANGILDPNFRPVVNSSSVQTIVPLADGRILMGGGFTKLNNIDRDYFGLLHADGSTDLSFHTSTGASYTVMRLLPQADGKFVMAGSFVTVGGSPAKYVARIAAPSVETKPVVSGISPNIADAGAVLRLTGSNLTNLTGIDFPGPAAAVFTVISDREVDVTVPTAATSGNLVMKSLYPDSVASMPFYRLPGIPGQVDPAFGIGAWASSTVYAMAREGSGKILVGGGFTSVGGVARARMVRLGADGSVDPGFVPPDGSGTVYALAAQPDGKILAGGYQIGSGNPLARLNADGGVDPTFSASSVGSYVYALALQPDGKILAGGSFSRRLARLNADGSADLGFDVGSGPDSTVRAIKVLPTGRILVAGDFGYFNEVESEGIVRLMPDGSVDSTFNLSGRGVSGDVDAMAVQADGSILIGGTFSSVNDDSGLKYLARLGPNGAVDTSFRPIPSGYIHALDITPDGRIAVGGEFTSISGSARDRVALLHADAAIVTGFSTIGGPSGVVRTVLPEADGGLIIGGSFANIGGLPPANLARLYGDGGQSRPAVSSISPTFAAAGEIVTVVGSNLAPLTSAEFAGGVTAAIDPVSETVVRLSVPIGAMSGPITLRNAYGVGHSGTVFRISSSPAPTLNAIPSGTFSVGQVFTLTGTHFYDVSHVRIGVVAADFTVISATEMSVTVPQNAVTGPVILTSPGGTEQSGSDLAVVKAPPMLTSVATAAGVVGVPFQFTLKATQSPTGFTAAPLPAGLVLNPLSGVISGIPTMEGSFTAAISATNAGGVANGSLEITIAPPPAPVITSVQPPFVVVGGKILVSGSCLTQTTGVTVGGVAASFTVLSDGKLSITLPAGASGPVEITTTQGSATGLESITPWNFQAGSQITGVGSNAAAELDVPVGLDDAIAISAGGFHSLALRVDGSIIGWGGDWVGQATPPVALAPVTAISAGGFHSLAIQADGNVVGWGRDDEGQCAGAAGLENVVAVAAGSYHSLALLRNGSVAAWGSNTNGQTSVPTSLGGVVAIAAGGDFSLALKSDGSVVAWGDNVYGQTNVPDTATNVIAISAGRTHAVALKADGTVVCWGADWTGQCQPPAGLANVVEISAGADHAIARRADGSVVGWGADWSGQATVSAAIADACAISTGGDHGLILRCTPPAPAVTSPLVVSGQPGQPLVFNPAVANGPFQFSAENLPTGLSINATTGEITGSPTRGGDTVATLITRNASGISRTNLRFFMGPYIIGWGDGLPSGMPQNAGVVVKVAAAESHCLALRADGTVIAWGNNAYGQSTVAAGLVQVVDIAAGADFSLALKSDGTVIGWGRSSYYYLPGPPNLWPSPLATNIVSISARDYTATGLTKGGTDQVLLSRSSFYGFQFGSDLIASETLTSDYGFSSIFTGIDRGGNLVGYQGSFENTTNGFVALAAADLSRYRSSLEPLIFAIHSNGRLYEIQSAYPFAGTSVYVRPETENAVEVAAGEEFGLIRNGDGTAVALAVTEDSEGYETISSAPQPVTETLVNVGAIAVNGRYALAVKSLAATPDIISSAVLFGRKNQPFTHQLVASSGPVTWYAPRLPAGLSLNSSTGKITGAPQGTGVSNFLVLVRGSNSFQTKVLSLKSTDGVPPVDLTLSASTVAEDLPTGTLVGTLSAIDYSPTDSFTYSLVSGPGSTDNSKFKISGNQLQTNASLDFESLPLTSVRIRVTDSGANTFEKVFSIQITGVDSDDDDGDGLTQAQEATLGTDPNVRDSDGDGASDGQEVAAGTNPLSASSRPTNYVACWGSNLHGQSKVPNGLGPVIAVAAGNSHTLALRADGTVAAWGNNGSNQCDVPESLSGVVGLAAGSNASFALKADGTVVAWGSSSYDLTSVPAGLCDVVEISAYDNNVAALRSNGEVVVWGSTYSGVDTVPESAVGAVQISMGDDFMLSLNRNGQVVGWGNSTGNSLTDAQGQSGYVSLAGGGYLSLGLDPLGKVSAWGTNTFGAGLVPAGLGPVQAIAAGYYFGLALETDGKVAAWGYNHFHQSEVPPGLGPVRAIAAGDYHGVSLVSNSPAPRFLTHSVNAVTGLPMARQLAYSGNADRFRADFLPPGISFNTTTATFTGTPQISGTFLVRVTAESGFERSTRIVPLHFVAPRIFEEWSAGHFPSGGSLGDPLADPDHDGTVNLIEYATARDPHIADSSPPALMSTHSTGGQEYLTLSYERRVDAADLECVVEVSGDLDQWASGPGATTAVSIVSHGETETVTVRDNTPLTSGRRFIRLKVVK